MQGSKQFLVTALKRRVQSRKRKLRSSRKLTKHYGYFRPAHPVRKFWRKLILWSYFEAFIIALIILNSLLLGIYDYENPKSKSPRNQIVNYAEPFFIAAFTSEAIMKIIALGFVLDKGTYLREAWNWLDFLVVLTSLLSLTPSMTNVSIIRTFRLFRPLRSFTALPAMKSIISTMVASLTKLGEIMIVAVIFFYIFSILGVSLWAGDIHYRWRETPAPVDGDWAVISEDTRLCGARKWQVGYWGSLVEQFHRHPGTLDLDKIGR